MSHNNKPKLYGSVLGVCAVALLLDKTILAPAEATADETAIVAATAVAVSDGTDIPLPDVAGMPTTPAHRFAQRLQSVAAASDADGGVVDAFAPPAAWGLYERQLQVESAGSTPLERFLAQHRLTGLMAGSSRSYAIIDGRMLFIGQSMNQYTLVAIAERSVTLERDGERFEVPLDRSDED